TSAKPDDLDKYLEWCRSAGRLKDVIVFGPGQGTFFNFLDYEASRSGAGGGQTEDIVKFLLNISEIRGRENSKGGGGENAEYFANAKEESLRATIDVLAMARQRISVPNIYKMIATAPNSIEEARHSQWRKESYCWACLSDAANLEKGEERLKDLDNAATYWLSAYPRLNEKTRTNITSSITGTIDLLNRGLLRQLFSQGTNVTPADIANGKILLFSTSVKEFGMTGALAQVIWKYAFQRDIERRNVQTNPRPVFLHIDEFQLLTTSYDSEFATTCRSSKVCFFILSQSLPTIWSALGGDEKARTDTASLLGNMNLKIFCANSEVETNRWIAETLGKRKQYLIQSSRSGGSSLALLSAIQPEQNSASISEHVDFQVQNSDLASLRMGGAKNNYSVDAIVYRTGQLFKSTGRNWMKTTFKQNAKR
ncbi:MAG TPA: TraM recognition domain-containing protein, partial [Terriglobales bacterium]|nr:TraM recognition domain-containing protein [Terriglobales bacterium]